MGEWDRSGRHAGPGRTGERWRAGGEPQEPRSFDFERDWVDPEYGGYTGESFGGAAPYKRETSVVGENPALDRVAYDELGRGWRETVGRGGQHRGRGPRNYVRSDARVHEDVSDAMSEDPWLDASEIEVAVRDGEVTLAGAVRSRNDKRRAEDHAWRTGGVKQVHNDLRVEPAESTRSGGIA